MNPWMIQARDLPAITGYDVLALYQLLAQSLAGLPILSIFVVVKAKISCASLDVIPG